LNRAIIAEGPLSVFIDSVAIFETNRSPKERIAGMAIITALDALLGILCITTPKACFGSCPTFYFNEQDGLTLVQILPTNPLLMLN